ncbi:MAG: hypothetical protein IJY84_02125 [Clostridia bacterium]|nr:hypothetical protein [Clostridia bacterium]
MRKLLILILTLIMALSAVACGEESVQSGSSDSAGGDDTVHTVTIYVSSGEMSAKNDDAYVKSKIEEKFYQDRGIKINLDVQVYSESDFNDVMSNKMASNSWDAAVGYIGQAGIDEIVISQNVCMELSDMIPLYDNLYSLVQDELTATTTIDGSVWGIPSLEFSNQYGVLVRTDYMARVGYTVEAGHSDDLGPIDAKPNGKLKTLVTIADFEDMMYRMKAQIPEITAPLSGYPWDVESTLTVGPFSNSGYTFKVVESTGDSGAATSVVPGQIAESYYETICLEYKWSHDGLWEEECYTGQKDKKIQSFVNGKTAIFTVDPEITKLISVARKCKAANPNATFTILEPLYGVDENGNKTDKRGYMAKQKASSCLVINKRSSKNEVILEYLDWLASEKANYDLATYGVENEHWISSGEGKYVYPANKKDRYETNPPYSGMYGLLKWQEYSYKLYDHYTAEEYGWIDTVRNAPTFKNVCENMLFIGEPTDMALNHQTAENDFFQDCLVKAWNGVVDPSTTFIAQAQRYRTTAAEYLTWLTNQYNLYTISRK